MQVRELAEQWMAEGCRTVSGLWQSNRQVRRVTDAGGINRRAVQAGSVLCEDATQGLPKAGSRTVRRYVAICRAAGYAG